MDNEDPEKRIAELERGLADRPPGSSDAGPLTAELVHGVVFSKPSLGKRGYNVDEADAFLEQAESALKHPTAPGLDAGTARAVRFSLPPLGARGYNEDQVDAFIDVIVAHLDAVEAGRQPPPAQWPMMEPPRPAGWLGRIIGRPKKP